MTNGVPRVLAVALGNGGLTPNVQTNGLGAVRRPIIRRLVGCLASEYGRKLGADYALDCLEAMNEAALQTEITTYLTPQRPDVVILAITTAAARAAKAARQSAGRPQLPIVFTVVSFPQDAKYGPLVGANGKGPHITGVSSSLVQSVLRFREEIKECFETGAGRGWQGYYMFDPRYVSSDLAWAEIRRNPDPAFPIDHRHINGSAPDVPAQISKEIANLPISQTGPRTCLFVGPSSAVFAHRDVAIQEAHRRDIPTFFQQPESVQSTNVASQSAVAGYGVSAETIGGKAAWMMDLILRDRNNAQDVVFVTPQDRELWVNETVAMQLGVTLKPACRAHAKVIF